MFWKKTLAILGKIGRPMLVIGDSHSLIYRQTVVGDAGKLTVPLHLVCGGGSASGLPNPNSRSGYGTHIEKTAAALNEAADDGASPINVLFAFGQVDVEFVYTYRRLRDRRYEFDRALFEEFCALFVGRYVNWVAALKLRNAVIVGINPPCLDDDFLVEGYIVQMQVYLASNVVDSRAEDDFDSLIHGFDVIELPCKVERTAHHRRLNGLIRREAEDHGLFYTDSFSRMMGGHGSIKPMYACAGNGKLPQVGLTGKDIHVGGKYAVSAKAALINGIPDAK